MKDNIFVDGIALCESFDASARASISVDIQKYAVYLEGSGMSETDQTAFLESLWSIIVNFVDLGYGVHPLQQVVENAEFSSLSPLKPVFLEAIENEEMDEKPDKLDQPINTLEPT